MRVTMQFEINEISLVDFHIKRTSEKVDVFLRNEKYVQCSPSSQGSRLMPFPWYKKLLITGPRINVMIDTKHSRGMFMRSKWSSRLTINRTH